MLEARLEQSAVLKRLLDSVKVLVTEANFDCGEGGISLQAMDTSHVALVTLLLRSSAFSHYRCDRNLTLGLNITNLSNILRCAGNSDVVTLRADEDGDVLGLLFEGKNDRNSEYQIKLMNIDSEHLGIPDSPYDATISMSSAEFQRICRDLKLLSESVTITCTKEGVQFSATGDTGSGTINLKNGAFSGSVDDVEDESPVKEEDGDEEMDDADEDGSSKKKAKKRNAVASKKKGSSSSEDKESDYIPVTLDINQPVSLQFSLKYLNEFAKGAPLSDKVSLCLMDDLPMMVEYKVDDIARVQYFLAPKIGGDDDEEED